MKTATTKITTKTFRSGNSQAVRIPAMYRFGDNETLTVRRDGDALVLEPQRRRWSRKFFAALGSASGLRRAEDVPPQPREGLMP